MRLDALRMRWQSLAPREKMLVGGAGALVALVLLWLVALAPALAVVRTSQAQHVSLDAQLQRMLALQAQAQALQSQPRQGYDEALRQLELSVRQRLGTSARMAIAGERVTLTLSGTPADSLAQWLTQARVTARALPGEAHIFRNSAGSWEGTLVLALPPR